MDTRILATELKQYMDEEVLIRGFLHSVRPLGKINFLIIRDRTGLSQIVVTSKEEMKKIAHLQPGSILSVRGIVKHSDEATLGCEVVDPSIEVEVPIQEVPPVDYYKPEMQSDLDFILDHRAISLRNQKLQAIFKVQAEIVHAFHTYMYEQVQATEYFGPNIIGSSSEGGAEFFSVDYFGYSATLAQSSQLYKQVMVGVYERVFAIMPFFRAEPSQTTRHLAEGKQLEFEMGFFSHWHEILDVIEGLVKSVAHHIETVCAKELDILGNKHARVPMSVSFPRLTFAEALQLVYDRTGVDEREEKDLSPAAERELCAWARETVGTDCVIVTDWKAEKRPFYSYINEQDPSLTNTFDLLCTGVEITSGGQRRHTYDSMVEGICSKEMNPNDFEDYLSIFKHGMPPHGGFGIGLERLTMTLLQIKNIREVSLFPSDPKRVASKRLKAKIFFGAENIRNEIIRLLNEQNVSFKHLTHEPVITSEDSAKIRGTSLGQGVKSIIVRGKKTKKNYQFNIAADKRLDMKAIAKIVGEKCEFEDPKVIEERFGLIVGSVPPFGQLFDLETFFDEGIQDHQQIAFNCGFTTESITMPYKDLSSIVAPSVALFSKS